MAATKINLRDLLDDLSSRRGEVNQQEEPSPSFKFIILDEGDTDPASELEFLFAFRTHDGAVILTKERYTLDAFEKVANELSLTDYEPIEFSGG